MSDYSFGPKDPPQEVEEVKVIGHTFTNGRPCDICGFYLVDGKPVGPQVCPGYEPVEMTNHFNHELRSINTVVDVAYAHAGDYLSTISLLNTAIKECLIRHTNQLRESNKVRHKRETKDDRES